MNENKKQRHITAKRILGIFAVVLVVSVVAMVGTAAAKGLFVCSEHHARQFDAWNIAPDGTITKQGTYGLTYASDPAGITIDTVDPHTGTIIFITSEFSSGIEIVEVPPVGTPTSLGRSSGPSNLAGIDVDDVDNILYTLRRATNDLYIYSWDSAGETLTQLAVIDLPGLSYGYGLALDDSRDVLWVSDTPNRMVRAYDVDVSAWSDISEIPSLSFPVSHQPVDVAVDSFRNVVYTVGGWHGSRLLTKYDVATVTETTGNLGHYGCGLAVEEINGYVYVTGGPYEAQDISVWDPSTSPFTKKQTTGDIGRPAGLAIANVIVNPLNLAKNDVVVGRGVYIGETFTYEITCDNTLNPDLDATGVTILDTLPVELDFVSETVDDVPGTGIYDPVEHTVFWDIGTIPAGGMGPLIKLVVRVNANAIGGSTIYNYCTIEGEQIPPTTVIGEDPDAPAGEEPGSYIIPNRPPVAVCKDTILALDDQGQATLNPSDVDGGSSDPDGDPITLSVDPTAFSCADIGSNTVTLTVTDDKDASDSCEATVTVVDTTPPVITCPADVTVEQETAAGTVVSLTATATDICDADVEITSDELAIYPLGTTTVTFTATDDSGNSATCTTTVTVIDTTLPEISVTVSPDTLWPPNHKMIDIVATVTVNDICDAAPTVVLTSVASDEPDNAQGKPYDGENPTSGDGNTVNDIQGADIGTEDYEFQLRAERAGAGDGRVYTIIYTVTDASGNEASASATVVVPHDME